MRQYHTDPVIAQSSENYQRNCSFSEGAILMGAIDVFINCGSPGNPPPHYRLKDSKLPLASWQIIGYRSNYKRIWWWNQQRQRSILSLGYVCSGHLPFSFTWTENICTKKTKKQRKPSLLLSKLREGRGEREGDEQTASCTSVYVYVCMHVCKHAQVSKTHMSTPVSCVLYKNQYGKVKILVITLKIVRHSRYQNGGIKVHHEENYVRGRSRH